MVMIEHVSRTQVDEMIQNKVLKCGSAIYGEIDKLREKIFAIEDLLKSKMFNQVKGGKS